MAVLLQFVFICSLASFSFCDTVSVFLFCPPQFPLTALFLVLCRLPAHTPIRTEGGYPTKRALVEPPSVGCMTFECCGRCPWRALPWTQFLYFSLFLFVTPCAGPKPLANVPSFVRACSETLESPCTACYSCGSQCVSSPTV